MNTTTLMYSLYKSSKKYQELGFSGPYNTTEIRANSMLGILSYAGGINNLLADRFNSVMGLSSPKEQEDPE